MRPLVFAALLAASLTLTGCLTPRIVAPATSDAAPGPVYTVTPTRTPEPNLAAGVCVFTTHHEAMTRGPKKPEPSDPVIKGIVNEASEKIYYVPGMRRYSGIKVDEATGGKWFCREPEAERAGWRAATAPRDETPVAGPSATPPRG